MFTCFVDLRAAFDKIDRNLLIERLKEKEIERNLRDQVAEVYKETGNVVRVEMGKTEKFWRVEGVKQGCPLSSTLFNAFLSDMKEEMKKAEERGVAIGKEKISTLAYVDGNIGGEDERDVD